MEPRTFSVLLLDDEHLALQLLDNFCARLPELEVKAQCRTPEEALRLLHSSTVDLLISDIQMPGLSGLSLLRSLPRPPVAIFTTAYSEHAVDAYALNVVDYLLKPFTFERFLQAIGKAKTLLEREVPTALPTVPTPPKAAPAQQHYVCKVDGRLEKIPFAEIIAVEGMKEYVKIICASRYYIALESMKNLEEILPSNDFVRTHKSYIVAIKQVRSLDGNLLILDKMRVPVSRERKTQVITAIFG